ncbi:general secretion pathway protein GspM [Pseudomonas sp. R-22-3w-18]|uniref:Type II secretion system protein M n=2 Tax=Pseudomonas xionganensis TaxID=2654845 RepID=A0A6I4KXX7_9PSED|nr:type II secretion system protein M [Pseudomonas xionganensis]MVW77265.1 general secretion pathway protein GspM [Pseudomonas xionganensis]
MSQMTKDWRGQLEQSQLLQRWRALAAREQMALAALGLFLALVLLYLGIWQPAQRQLLEARQAFAEQRELHAYLQAHADLARGLSASPQQRVEPERLQGLVTSSAQQQGLSIERLDGDGAGMLQVNLQAAPFAQLLRWFAVLQEQGVEIAEAGLERSDDNRVLARLSLRVAP